MAKKGIKNFIFIIIGSLLLLQFFGIIDFSVLLKGSLIGAIFPSDMKINSISTNIPVISNDQDMTKVNYIINATLSGNGETIVGTITPEQTKLFSSGKFESVYPLEFSATSLPVKVYYRNAGAYTPIYDYDLVKTEMLFLEDKLCPSNTFKEYSASKYLLWKVKYCVIRKQIGQYVNLEKDSTLFGAKFTLSSHGISLTKTITSSDTQISFSDSKGLLAAVTMNGALVSGYEPPSGSGYVAVYNNSLNKWFPSFSSVANEYSQSQSTIETILKSQIPNSLDSWTSALIIPLGGLNILAYSNICYENKKNCDDYFNSLFSSIKTDILNKQANAIGSFSYVNVSSTDQPKFYVETKSKILNPMITMNVRADWIGLKVPVAAGKIESLVCPQVKSGQELTITSKVVASYPGSMYTIANCPNFVQKNDNKAYVDTAYPYYFFSYLNYNMASGQTNNCVVQLKNNLGTVLDQKNISCTVEKPMECTPGTTNKTAYVLYECDASGKWVKKIDCNPNTQELRWVNGEWKCVSIGIPPIIPPPILFEVCGNNIDDDGDGQIDEGCDKPCDLKDIGDNCPISNECKYVPKEGWTIKSEDTPEYWFGLSFLPETGKVTTKTTCEKLLPYDIITYVIIFLGFILLFFYGKKKRWW